MTFETGQVGLVVFMQFATSSKRRNGKLRPASSHRKLAVLTIVCVKNLAFTVQTRQKAFILKLRDDGVPLTEICRKAGISSATYLRGQSTSLNGRHPSVRTPKTELLISESVGKWTLASKQATLVNTLQKGPSFAPTEFWASVLTYIHLTKVLENAEDVISSDR